MAAEGAILNEMLDIVAKRAALRANEPQNGANSFESDVSPVNYTACSTILCPTPHTLLIWLMPIFVSVLCMFYLHSAQFF